ncbi:MAG TPA: sulfatase [Candidatus Latescibacteria bacterium]|nr:sulfatase [Candidatus Latescibacterota bacterium]
MTQNPLNLVVVICHDLGQHLGCYGVPGIRSPHIDAFADFGVRFAKSFCTAPQCSPSRAALWTGRFPHANGVVGLTHAGFANDLNPDEVHLAQMLRAAGYDTHLFGLQHEARLPERCGHEHIHGTGTCAKVADDFITFMRSRDDAGRPFFAQIGFAEPHRPFPHDDVDALPPDSVSVPPYMPNIPEVREDLSEMEASIASADRAFGRIVEAVRTSPAADNTILIFTTDHGIPFVHAKMTLYDPGIEVALIMSVPGAAKGIVRNEMISNVDVMPTLLDLLGMPIPTNLHGRSFSALFSDVEYTPNDAVFAEKTYHTYYDPMRCIRTDRWKLIANFENAPWQETSPDYFNNAKSYVEVSKALNVPYSVQYHVPYELFDLEADPYEQYNLADSPDHRAIRDALIVRLRNWMRDTGDPLLDGPMAQAAYRIRMADFTQAGNQPDG